MYVHIEMPLMHGLDGKHLRICLTLTSETKRGWFSIETAVLEYIS